MDKDSYKDSSFIASLPFICFNFGAGALLAYSGRTAAAAVLMLLFVLGLAAYLWAAGSTRRLFCDFFYSSLGLFPGETLDIEIKLKNDKLIPVPWITVDDGCSGAFSCEGLLWYEEASVKRQWTADKRGIKRLENRSVITGDGFGLRQRFLKDSVSGQDVIAVYPRRVEVDPRIFMKDLWNADTGRRGTMEDVTVIRQERPYQTGDPARRINFRLAARNLPLSVNVYEDILPRGVHFLFDGESFARCEDELEEALSILASELAELDRLGFASSLSVCEGKSSPAVTFGPGTPLEDMLFSLAAYENYETKRLQYGEIVVQDTVFDRAAVQDILGRVGRFYYVCKNAEAASRSDLLSVFSKNSVTLLVYEGGGAPWTESIPLRTLLL